jgi:putative intracellular protease/amidase
MRVWRELPLRRQLRLRQDRRVAHVTRTLLIAVALLASATAPAHAQIAPYQARFERARPVIAVIGENTATELIDFVIPYGILSQSGAADVLAVAARPGAMNMRPALHIAPQATIESFDERYPDGADYVIVPAMMFADRAAEGVVLGWITSQAGKGAKIVSICDGSLVVAQTGLLKGHRATGHWATQSRRERHFPETQWIKNTRYVADGQFISSAGVTAAIPLSLALVESIAGKDSATRLASDLGVRSWSAEHDSEQFHLDAGKYFTAIRNYLAPSREFGIPVADGVNEISLALTADSFSRTYRSRALTVARNGGTIKTQNGLTLLPDRVVGEAHVPRQMLTALAAHLPGQVLDQSLADITALYGQPTASFVAMQLEYPRSR